jgi:hypothetical protein
MSIRQYLAFAAMSAAMMPQLDSVTPHSRKAQRKKVMLTKKQKKARNANKKAKKARRNNR